MSELRKRMIRAALEAGAAERKLMTSHACQAALDALDAAEAEIERLRALLADANEELLWSAYAAGHEEERDGAMMWTHCFMSDGEWLAKLAGFDPKKARFPAAKIKEAIPEIAKRLIDKEAGDD